LLANVAHQRPTGVDFAASSWGKVAMGLGIKRAVISVFKDAIIRTGIGHRPVFSVYNYMFDPEQLRLLMDLVVEAAEVPGSCVEAGCANGATTALLRKWMACRGIKKDYYAIDTFCGFLPDHVEYEIKSRSKPQSIRYPFSSNKKAWFDHSMKLSRVDGVTSIEADVASFDFSSVAPIAFCLLDVDLYVPVAAALPKLYDHCSPGAVIVCDDCQPNSLYDGALQAYEEFVQARHLPDDIRCGKLGIIHKPRGV
jgi:O-methyltransferase